MSRFMDLSRVALLATCGLVTAASAQGQDYTRTTGYPSGVTPTAYRSREYYVPQEGPAVPKDDTSSPSDIPTATGIAPVTGSCNTCTTSCCADFCKTSCDNCDPPLPD